MNKYRNKCIFTKALEDKLHLGNDHHNTKTNGDIPEYEWAIHIPLCLNLKSTFKTRM